MPPPYKAPGQIQVVRTRVSRLTATGAPAVGVRNMYVSSALIQLVARPDVTTGDQIEQKNAAGDVCLSYRDEDKLKGVLFDLQLCTPDPELIHLLQGGTLLTDAGVTRGLSYPRLDGSDRNEEGVSIECWAKAISNGDQDSELPYYRYVFPRTKWWPGDKTLENGPALALLSGKGSENSNFGNGPMNDIPTWAISPAAGYYFLDDDPPPAAAVGLQTTLAEAAFVEPAGP